VLASRGLVVESAGSSKKCIAVQVLIQYFTQLMTLLKRSCAIPLDYFKYEENEEVSDGEFEESPENENVLDDDEEVAVEI
jgi:hypothetical protein